MMDCVLYRVARYDITENRDFSGLCLLFKGRVVWDEVIEDELEAQCDITDDSGDTILISVFCDRFPGFNFIETLTPSSFGYYRVLKIDTSTLNQNEWHLVTEPLTVEESPSVFLE